MTAQDPILRDLISLPEAAAQLGVHRATVNEMVNSGRIRGYRLGAHWFVRREELENFAVHYRRPKNSPRRRTVAWTFHWQNELLRWLHAWETATASELARVVDLHVGNIRKYLTFSEQEGLVTRDEYGYWSLTVAGHERAQALPPAGEAGSPDRQEIA